MWHWSAAQWVLRLETDFRVGSGQCFPPDKQQCRTWRKRRADALSPEIGAQDQKNEGGHKVVAVEGGCECGEWKRRSGKTFSFFFPFFFFFFFFFSFSFFILIFLLFAPPQKPGLCTWWLLLFVLVVLFLCNQSLPGFPSNEDQEERVC